MIFFLLFWQMNDLQNVEAMQRATHTMILYVYRMNMLVPQRKNAMDMVFCFVYWYWEVLTLQKGDSFSHGAYVLELKTLIHSICDFQQLQSW